MENQEFLIPLNGLAPGKTIFRWKADRMFFEGFGNAGILDADLVAEAVVEKAGRKTDVDCSVSGTVTVQCDRCMDDLVLPVDTGISLAVRYGQETGEDEADGRETVHVQAGEHVIDMRQVIYDYVCLSLPMQKFHEEGGCNPDALAVLRGGISLHGQEEPASPFAALGGLFAGKAEDKE